MKKFQYKVLVISGNFHDVVEYLNTIPEDLDIIGIQHGVNHTMILYREVISNG